MRSSLVLRVIALCFFVAISLSLFSCSRNDDDVGDEFCAHRDADDDTLCDKCADPYSDGKDIVEPEPCRHRDADDDSLCDICKEAYSDGKDIPESTHSHSFGEWVKYSYDESTPCDARLYYRICTTCSDIEWMSGGYAAHTMESVVTEPSCLEGGYTENTCTECGFYEKTDYTDALGHSFETNTVAPSCTSLGYDYRACKVCGYHDIVNQTGKIPHTYEKDYSSDSLYHWRKCSECGDKAEYEKHIPGSDGFCKLCKKELSSGVMYETSADGSFAYVAGYSGSSRDVFIASEYEGLPVRIIYVNAFKGAQIKSVTIPDSVTTICDSAFSDCGRLTRVSMGSGVSGIGAFAFYNCCQLSEIEMSDSLESIGYKAFAGCSALRSIVIPATLAKIDYSAFDVCVALKDVYYGGTAEEWLSIGIEAGNYELTGKKVHFDYSP